MELTDRIRVEIAAEGELAEAVAAHGAAIAAETLAVDLRQGEAAGGQSVDVGASSARVLVERA